MTALDPAEAGAIIAAVADMIADTDWTRFGTTPIADLDPTGYYRTGALEQVDDEDAHDIVTHLHAITIILGSAT